MFDTYNILQALHVLAAVVWVGGAVTLNVMATRLQAAGDPTRLMAFARDTEWMGKRVYLPSSIAVLVFGALAVIVGEIGFSTLWVAIGLIGIVVTALTGSLFIGPESKRVADLADDRGVEDPEVRRRIARLFKLARIDLVVLLVVVVDMVVKPT